MKQQTKKIIISTVAEKRFLKFAQNFDINNFDLINFPAIEIIDRQLNEQEIEDIKLANNYDLIIFTSINGVNIFFKILEILKMKLSIKIAVVGLQTAQALSEHDRNAYYISKGNSSEDLANELFEFNLIQRKKILIIQGEQADNILENKISRYANVKRINIYNTITPQTINQQIYNQIKEFNYDMLVFTSASAITNFFSLFEKNYFIDNQRFAVIGEKTKLQLIENNYQALITSHKTYYPKLANDIQKYFYNL